MPTLTLEWPLTMICGTCGHEDCRAYPYPAPTGSMFCPSCSPSWLEDFLIHATEETRANGFQASK